MITLNWFVGISHVLLVHVDDDDVYYSNPKNIIPWEEKVHMLIDAIVHGDWTRLIMMHE